MICILIALCVCIGPILILLACASYWRHKYLETLRSANYNAALWAESEARRCESEARESKLNAALEVSDKVFVAMSKIASDAITMRAAEVGLGSSILARDDDSILNAQDIG